MKCVKNVTKIKNCIKQNGVFSEMRGGEINDVAFCTTSHWKRIWTNHNWVQNCRRRNNRRGVSRNAELMFLQLGFKGCIAVFNRGDDLLPATSTLNFHSVKLVRTPIFLLSIRRNNKLHAVRNIVCRRIQRCCLTERMSLEGCWTISAMGKIERGLKLKQHYQLTQFTPPMISVNRGPWKGWWKLKNNEYKWRKLNEKEEF